MDVQLITTGVLDLPSSQRVDAIVHDGTTDLRLWRPPGPDRELLEHYGDELPTVLDRERARKPEGLAIGELLRLHRGKLHCDFLLWIATRPPEVEGVRAPAPSAEVLRKAVTDALAFASERHVERIAFGPMGAGPGELDEVERLVIIGRAANAYYEACYAAGRPAGIEDVLLCHPHSAKIGAARRQLGSAVKVVAPAASSGAGGTTKRRRASSSRASSGRSAAAPKTSDYAAPIRPLTPAEVGHARATAGPYDRAVKYQAGQYFLHGKFGVGLVEEVTPEDFILVRFEGGQTKRLLHNRP